jgi:hypothetical protein
VCLRFLPESGFAQRHRPDQARLALFEFFEPEDHVEEEEEQDADAGDEHGVGLVLDAGGGGEVTEQARVDGHHRDRAPKERPQHRLPHRFLFAGHQTPRVADGYAREERNDDLVGGDGHNDRYRIANPVFSVFTRFGSMLWPEAGTEERLPGRF